ncbi:MAG: hypothetical protein AAGB32_00460 [Pseudomonadota bacterium]
MSKATRKNYRTRYVRVLSNLTEIAGMRPKKLYMYKLMNTVIFQDFETALDSVIEDFNIANDNKK